MKLPTRTLAVLAIDVVMTALALVLTYVLLHGIGSLSLLRFKVAAAFLAAPTNVDDPDPAFDVVRGFGPMPMGRLPIATPMAEPRPTPMARPTPMKLRPG